MTDATRGADQGAGRNAAPPEPETFNLREKLAQVLRGAINLRVVTASGEPTMSGAIEGLSINMGAAVPEAITNINLVEGDIVTVYRTSESQERYKELHEAMLQKAEGIVERNVRLIMELIDKNFGDVPVPAANKTTTTEPAGD